MSAAMSEQSPAVDVQELDSKPPKLPDSWPTYIVLSVTQVLPRKIRAIVRERVGQVIAVGLLLYVGWIWILHPAYTKTLDILRENDNKNMSAHFEQDRKRDEEVSSFMSTTGREVSNLKGDVHTLKEQQAKMVEQQAAMVGQVGALNTSVQTLIQVSSRIERNTRE